jgi:hypothetical protein
MSANLGKRAVAATTRSPHGACVKAPRVADGLRAGPARSPWSPGARHQR